MIFLIFPAAAAIAKAVKHGSKVAAPAVKHTHKVVAPTTRIVTNAATKGATHAPKAVHHVNRIVTSVQKPAWTAGGGTVVRKTIPTQSAHQVVKEITKPH